jgi:hypothetical protein
MTGGRMTSGRMTSGRMTSGRYAVSGDPRHQLRT